jgi:hypothetical protein
MVVALEVERCRAAAHQGHDPCRMGMRPVAVPEERCLQSLDPGQRLGTKPDRDLARLVLRYARGESPARSATSSTIRAAVARFVQDELRPPGSTVAACRWRPRSPSSFRA